MLLKKHFRLLSLWKMSRYCCEERGAKNAETQANSQTIVFNIPTRGNTGQAGDTLVTRQERQRADEPGRREDPEDQGGADGKGYRYGGRDPEGRGGAGATEDQGGVEGKEEPDRARGTRRSRRSGVPRRKMVDDRPRRSWREEGARRSQWTDGPRWKGGN